MRFQILSAVLVVMTCALAALMAPQDRIDAGGIVNDWSTRHVVFSDPGGFADAIRNGKFEEWRRVVTDPRYRMQQLTRNIALSGTATESVAAEGSQNRVRWGIPAFHRDWALTVGTSNHSIAADMFPAKYTFSPIGSPNCVTDFVVFEVNSPGNASQAEIVGANNLYSSPTCTGTVPNVIFAYNVGTGIVQTSPSLSLDGTKIAFVESFVGGATLHVVTLDMSGNSGCPNTKPCNGTAWNQPATPGGTLNNAVDVPIALSGGAGDTRSGPFVDYKGDIAYVGDNSGKLHKFTGVFKGTPAEAGSPWPVTVASGVILDSPIFDGGTSQSIFVGGSDGNLYCVTAAGAACSTASISVASGTSPGPVLDSPIVDSTTQKVFAAGSNSSNTILLQTTTALATPVRVTMGTTGTDVYDGAFDNAYFTNVSTGHMYFCGNLTTAATPTLWRVTFNASGTMSSANDGSSFQLVTSGNTGTGVDCTPLTEVFNPSLGKDLLFLGVTDHGFSTGTPNCTNKTCVMSFSLPTVSPFTFPTTANATFTGTLGNNGLSGIIIDNVSAAVGASQIYFGDRQNSTGVQASQGALQ